MTLILLYAAETDPYSIQMLFFMCCLNWVSIRTLQSIKTATHSDESLCTAELVAHSFSCLCPRPEKMLFLWRVSLSNLQIMQMSLAGAKVWTYCTGCNCLMLCVCVCTTGIPHIFSPYTQSHYKNTLHGQSCTDAPGHIPYFCELVQGWRNKCPFNLFQNCCKGHSLLEGNSTRGKGSYIPSWMRDHWCTYMEVNVVTKKTINKHTLQAIIVHMYLFVTSWDIIKCITFSCLINIHLTLLPVLPTQTSYDNYWAETTVLIAVSYNSSLLKIKPLNQIWSRPSSS